MGIWMHSKRSVLLLCACACAFACGAEDARDGDGGSGGAGMGTGGLPGAGGTLGASGGGTSTGSGGGPVSGSGGAPVPATGGAAGNGTGGSDAGMDGTGGDPGSGGSSPSEPTSGCDQPAPQTGERTIAVTGVPEGRSYLLDIPPDYDSSRPYPVVFGFHGATTSAAAFRSQYYGNLPAVAGDEAILVHGQAMSINGTTAWNHDSDLDYFDAVLAEVTRELCVDAARIFATGHSSGGFYSNQLGCYRGDVLRAIAPLAGGGPAFGPFMPPCVGQVAVWLEHGADDMTVVTPVGEASRDYWLGRNHCELDGATPTEPSGCVAYPGCDDGYPVHWCESPGGHEPRPGFTAAGAWDFFKSL